MARNKGDHQSAADRYVGTGNRRKSVVEGSGTDISTEQTLDAWEDLKTALAGRKHAHQRRDNVAVSAVNKCCFKHFYILKMSLLNSFFKEILGKKYA